MTALKTANYRLLPFVLSALFGLGCWCVYQQILPGVSAGIVESPGNKQTAEPPFFSAQEVTNAAVSFNLHLSASAPGVFYLAVRDCLVSLEINNRSLPLSSSPICTNGKRIKLDLKAYLRRGINTVRAEIRSQAGPTALDLEPANTDTFIFSFRLQLLALLALTAFFARRAFSFLRTIPAGLYSVFVLGVMLRLVYFFSTSWTMRTNDLSGHIEYINYVRHFWTVPQWNTGWSYFQAPLYYFISALWWNLAALAGGDLRSVLRGLQSLSLLYSTGFLFFALWTLRLLGQMAKPHFPLNSAALFIAVYPGTMLSTVRISNDSLAQLLIAATITLAVRWWMKGDNTSWYSAIAVLGAAMLTKSNAMIIAPLPFILLCFFPFLTWREKLRLGGAAAVLLVLFYGWYFVEREYVQKQEFFIGNLPVMNRALFVEDDWSSYLVFNPRAVLEIPYVNTFTDQSRRRFTWEFWYRSSFFGEYQFPGFNEHLRTTLLVSGMALYLLAALGVILYLRGSRHQALPMFIVLSLFCIGEIASRVKVPLAGAAEFRYTVFAVIPAAYFFAAAIRQNRLLHLMGLLLMIAFAVSAVSFLGYLYLSPGQASIPELNLFG